MRAGLAAASLLCCLLFPANPGSAADLQVLEPHGQAEIGGLERFVAAEAFKTGNRIGDRVLGVVGLSFEKHFLSVVETHMQPASLQVWTLRYSADDALLISLIQGQRALTLQLSAIHRLMELGRNAGSHTDGRSNFAYVRASADGGLWAIHWLVNERGEWVVGAVQVPHPDLFWFRGSRVFAAAAIQARAPKPD
jgi:hypothetical protein